MIYFLELNKGKEAHSSLNYSMIKVLSVRERDITIFSSALHFEAIGLDSADLAHVTFSPIHVIDGNWTSWFSKVIVEIVNTLKIFKRARRERVNFIYISSLFPISHLFVRIIMLFFPMQHVIIGLHGEMEFLRSNKSRRLRFLGWFLKLSFLIPAPSNFRYLVFGSIIKRNIIISKFLPEEMLLSIDHPYDYRSQTADVNFFEHTINFGTIGIGSINKKTQNLFLLADSFKEEVLSSKISFHLIGTMLSNLEPYVNPYVNTNGTNNMLSKEDFDSQISALHYSLFFYDNDFYKLCASGAFFDSVKLSKPILALKNDFFVYYFEKLGNIGYLFNDLEEMKAKIADIMQGHCDIEYEMQLSNLKNAKQRLSIPNIAHDFFSQLKDSSFCI